MIDEISPAIFDTIRYELYSTHTHFVVLFDKLNKEFCIHSKDIENDVAMIVGFGTAAQAIEFAHTRVRNIEELSTVTKVTCEWERLGAGRYRTKCENMHIFSEEGSTQEPEDISFTTLQHSGFLYCPYCGGLIEEWSR